MLAALAESVFGSANSRYLKRLEKKVSEINALEPELSALSDDVLRSRTEELRTRHKSGETLDELLCESFAVVREDAKGFLRQRQRLGSVLRKRRNHRPLFLGRRPDPSNRLEIAGPVALVFRNAGDARSPPAQGEHQLCLGSTPDSRDEVFARIADYASERSATPSSCRFADEGEFPGQL